MNESKIGIFHFTPVISPINSQFIEVKLEKLDKLRLFEERNNNNGDEHTIDSPIRYARIEYQNGNYHKTRHGKILI